MKLIIITFLLGILSSIIANALFPSFSDLLSRIFVISFSWIPTRQNVNLSGNWQSTWHVDSERFAKAVTSQNVVVRQLWNRFYARFTVGKVDFYAYGQIDGGRYVTGLWKDKTEGGYHGAFQLIIDPHTRDMNGLWIGFSTTGVVKQGIWEWRRQ